MRYASLTVRAPDVSVRLLDVAVRLLDVAVRALDIAAGALYITVRALFSQQPVSSYCAFALQARDTCMFGCADSA